MVLILVLVEDGLGDMANGNGRGNTNSLNPCFSGGWSRSQDSYDLSNFDCICLNPCFSGGWSRRFG